MVSGHLFKVKHYSSNVWIGVDRVLDIEKLVVGRTYSLGISIIGHFLLFLSSTWTTKIIIVILNMMLYRNR